MGYDAFGLPAENAAIREGGHPREVTERNIAAIRAPDQAHGLVDRLVARGLDRTSPSTTAGRSGSSCSCFEAGLAYRKAAPVKWCPNDQTVLANEQVIDGRCERCGAEVESRNLEQWMFKITDYADRLLDDMALLESWPERVLTMQRNWIGRSEGAEVDLPGRGARRGRARLHDAARTRCSARRSSCSRPSIRSSSSSPSARRARRRAARVRAPRRREEERGARGQRGEDRRLHRLLRRQPGQRRAHPDLGRRLRADGLRHRRDHGRARARRARLRVRREVRPADRAGRRARRRRGRGGRGVRRRTPTTRCSSTRASSRGLPSPEAKQRDRRVARASAASASRRSTTACATGCSRASATGAARSRSIHCERLRHRRRCPTTELPVLLPEVDDYLPKGRSPLAAAEDWVNVDLPVVRRRGAARDRHDGHLRRLVLVLPALHRPAERRGAVRPRHRRLLAAGQPVHRRDRARDPAPDVRALLHEGAERPRAASASASRSRGSSTRG